MLNSKSKQNILSKVHKLKHLYNNGGIDIIKIHEVHPQLPIGDRIHYIYFTLPVAINFQRNSPSMWSSALKTFEDPDTNYLFYPEKVVTKSFEEVQTDLGRHRLGLQKNKHTHIWYTISKTLLEKFDSDPRNIIKAGNNDVIKIKNIVMKDFRKEFPYLSGTKIGNYWLFILDKFTDIRLTNKDQISIIPDVHVFKSSIELGLIEDFNISSIKLEDIWFDLLKDSGITPAEMHPVLWNWSRNKFIPSV